MKVEGDTPRRTKAGSTYMQMKGRNWTKDSQKEGGTTTTTIIHHHQGKGMDEKGWKAMSGDGEERIGQTTA